MSRTASTLAALAVLLSAASPSLAQLHVYHLGYEPAGADAAARAALYEECDGTDLGGVTCASLGLGGGTLACGVSCALDTSGCSPAERPEDTETQPDGATDGAADAPDGDPWTEEAEPAETGAGGCGCAILAR